MPAADHGAAPRGAARLWISAALCAAAVVLFVLVFRLSGGSPMAATLAFGGVMAAALAVSVWWWRGVDEAVREAHKAAWFWGGLVAVSAGAPFLILLRSAPDLLERAGTEPHDLFVAGVLAALTVQLVGYTIAWAVWWPKRR